MLNIDKSTLLRWIRQGKIPDVTHRDGRNWRVWLPEDVTAAKEYHEMIHNLSLGLKVEDKAKEPAAAGAEPGGSKEDGGGN